MHIRICIYNHGNIYKKHRHNFEHEHRYTQLLQPLEICMIYLSSTFPCADEIETFQVVTHVSNMNLVSYRNVVLEDFFRGGGTPKSARPARLIMHGVSSRHPHAYYVTWGFVLALLYLSAQSAAYAKM
jgi:hypothetical protein